MKRLSWSKFFNLTALLSLALVTMVASVNGATVTLSGPTADRSPQTANVGARVPATDPNSGAIKAWEGFQTTNYLSTEPYTFTPPTAAIAVGPVNILTVVNRRVAMYDNPNALLTTGPVGASPTGTTIHSVPAPTAVVTPANPGNTQFISNFPPTAEALLDAMLGETILNDVCPTSPQTTVSCLIDNATVRYDQMHGRYLIGMTVTDTGVQTIGGGTVRPRKASWVLIISRFSQFPTVGQTATSDIFICASGSAANCSRPGPNGTTASVTGGLNKQNWTVYYGGASNDGFGGPVNGSINDIPGDAASAGVFNCAAGAIGSTTAVCYFPTGLRIGIDNDNIILTSPVLNANLPPGTNQFAGTRVRVIKKGTGAPGTTAGLYQKSLTAVPLVAGAPLSAGIAATQAACTALMTASGLTATQAANACTQGDYYDLYATTNPNPVVTADVTPLAAGAFSAPFSFSPYTVAPPTTATALTLNNGIFCEPERVRGRAMASYTNSMLPTTAAITSQSYLECAISVPAGAAPISALFVQPIQYVVTNFTFALGTANVNSAVSYYPRLPANFDGTIGTMQVAIVPAYTNPGLVPQAAGTAASPAPSLYVGDNRPHELVMREGYLYDARVGADASTVITAGASPVISTVYYDVLQKFALGNPSAQVNPVLLSRWTNTNAYAPEYEVPANVTTMGQTPPINTFNWLEKLFVATTYPQLASSDPRVQPAGTAGAPSAGTQNKCTSSSIYPNTVGAVPNVNVGPGGSTANIVTFPGLFDQHCGLDAYDTPQQFRDPVTGVIVTQVPASQVTGATAPFVSPGVRGGASTDPNNGSLWNFGLYAQQRFSSVQGFGQLGSYVSNYDLAFPTTDPYNNSTGLAKDCVSQATCPFFVPVQIAINQGLATLDANGNVGINAFVTRAEMAKFVVLGMMDEKAVTNFLQQTGGCTTSFADVASDCNSGVSGGTVPAAASTGSFWRYIETMARKKITTGCFANDAIQQYCPTANLTRAQMAVFLIRAKMNNVYPSVISGCPSPQAPACPGITGGDNFGLTVGTQPYFADVTTAASDPFASYFLYVQKMFELRITNGVNPPPGVPLYGPGQTLTKGQILTFVVRAFFY
jgi:hypothetical protein